MEKLANWLTIGANGLTVLICAFILTITIISHLHLRKFKRDTIGRKTYRYLLVLFCLCGFYFGWAPATYIFLIAAVVCERLIVYRGCRWKKDKLGAWLAKIDW